MDASHWVDQLHSLFAGRKVLLCGAPVAQQAATVRLLLDLGAERPFVLGDGVGSGELPSRDEAEWYALDSSGATMMEALRASMAALGDLPGNAIAALDRWDPRREAIVIGSFLHELAEVAGRPAMAWRRPAWVALEDKVVAGELWDSAGVVQAPSAVVPARLENLRAAARLLDQGSGTVWVGDAREGFHGGAEHLRWVRTAAGRQEGEQAEDEGEQAEDEGEQAEDEGEQAEEEAAAVLAARCDRARVMPFLEGVPCSIHGLVFDDAVVALRPLEMVTLRRPAGSQLVYTGAASYWDPPDADREDMREVARRVGRVLREQVAFRGPFTVDGVMTADGFRPTELNPRSGAGLATLARGVPELPLSLLLPALAGGVNLDWRPADLESLILAAADAHRSGGTWRAVPRRVPTEVDAPLVHADGLWRRARPCEPADGTMLAGPSTLGGFARLLLDHRRWPVGPSVAPAAAAFWTFADAELGTGLGPLEPCRDVRRAP